MRRSLGRKVMFFFFGKKKDNPRGFPAFISKTDEERVENQPWRIGDGKTYLATEKLDGTSCTYALERKGKKKFEFYVCSRNVRQQDEKQECYHDHNIYWDLAFKYNIERHLKGFLIDHPECKWVCIQGEGVGSVQGNPLKLTEDDLYVFNFKDSSKGRWPSRDGRNVIEDLWNMKWVPILGEVQMPDTMEELKELATGKSVVNPKVLREGLVYRSLDGSDSFKNVSREYLLKHNQ
jgi:RNA ligase (TIGR02306 family)